MYYIKDIKYRYLYIDLISFTYLTIYYIYYNTSNTIRISDIKSYTIILKDIPYGISLCMCKGY